MLSPAPLANKHRLSHGVPVVLLLVFHVSGKNIIRISEYSRFVVVVVLLDLELPLSETCAEVDVCSTQTKPGEDGLER